MISPKSLSVLATIAAVAGIVVLLLTHNLLGNHIATIIVQIAAVLLMVWARVTFGMRSFHFSANTTEGGLVTSGPYAFVRNPIYSAVLLFAWAGVIEHFSLVGVLAGLLVTAGMLVRVFSEERFLRERYPEYGEYARRVRRLIPFIY